MTEKTLSEAVASAPENLDAFLSPVLTARWLGVSRETLDADRTLRAFKIGDRLSVYHPRSVIAVKAEKAGMSLPLIAAMFGNLKTEKLKL